MLTSRNFAKIFATVVLPVFMWGKFIWTDLLMYWGSPWLGRSLPKVNWITTTIKKFNRGWVRFFYPFYNLWLCLTCLRVSTAFSTSSTMLSWPWYDVIQTLFIDIHKQVHLNLSMACEYRKRSIAQVYVQGRCTLSLPQVVIKQKSSWWWYITYYGNLEQMDPKKTFLIMSSKRHAAKYKL